MKRWTRGEREELRRGYPPQEMLLYEALDQDGNLSVDLVRRAHGHVGEKEKP